MDKVGIMNAALGKLAQDITIASPSEQTKHARAMNRAWDYCLDYVLAARSWPFATKTQALAVSSIDPPPGWGYRYDYPSDCMTAMAVTDDAGVRAALRGGLSTFDFEKSSGGTLLADLEDAYLVYSARVADTGQFPIHFCEALACRLAWECAPVIAADIGLKLRPQLLQDFAYALNEAAVHEMNEGRDRGTYITPSLAARPD